MSISPRARRLAQKTEDAYSADAYRSWAAVAQLLIDRGYSDQECEAILRSKWTRWARDMAGISKQAPASVVGEYLDSLRVFRSVADRNRQLARLVAESL